MRNLNEGKKKAPSYMAELSEIDKQSAIVAMEAKINKLAEMVEAKTQRLNMVSEDENLSELIDKKRVKMMEREIKEIEKAKLKLEKLYEKACGSRPKEIVDEDASEDSALDDSAVGVTDEKEDMGEGYSTPSYEEGDTDPMNEEFNRFRKLAGIPLKEESELKIYGIVKDYQPFAFGPYTKSEATRKAAEYNAKEGDGGFGPEYDIMLYNTMRDMLPPIERMHIPKLNKHGEMPDEWDTTPFSAGDLADY